MSFSEQHKKQERRAQVGLRASLAGLLINAVLAGSKIIGGLFTGSVSILADGINNLSDMGAVMISIISLIIAKKPEDKEHPFGHARMEYIGSLAIGIIILIIGIDLLKTSVQTILNPEREPIFSWFVVALTAASIPIKLFLCFFYRKWGQKYSLATLIASSQDSFNDSLITTSVLIGLLLSHFFGIKTDGWTGILVSLFILYSGIGILKETVNSLIGGNPDKELGNRIIGIIQQYPEIIGTHDFILHDYGPGRSMASIHAEVPADVKLVDVHGIVDQAEQQIMRELGIPINIHMDPVETDDPAGLSRKKLISDFLEKQTPPLSLHDFRSVPGKNSIKLIFDITVPAGYKNEELLKQQVTEYAKRLDVRHNCVIGIDKDYFTDGDSKK